MNDKNFFTNLENYLCEAVAPQIEQIDHDPMALAPHFIALKKLGVFKLLIPTSMGGLGGDLQDYAQLYFILAQHSVALLFLQSQHQGAMLRLYYNHLFAAQPALIAEIVSEHRTIGIANATRNQGLTVQLHEQHFYLTGKLFWATGWQFLDYLCLQINIEDEVLLLKIPFTDQTRLEGNIHFTEPMPTLIANSTNTVQAELKQWRVEPEEIIFRGALTQLKSPTFPAIHCFAGFAKKLLALITASKYADKPIVQQQHIALTQRLQEYNALRINFNKEKITTLTQGRTLAEDCATLARVCYGGQVLLVNNPIQRICHAIWLYSVAGLSEEIVIAYLDAL